jgi:hypothetical protein
MVISIFLFCLIVGLAVWKGGEPFRVFGEGMIIMGQKISEFGGFVDEVVNGSNEVKRTYKKFKKVIDTVEEN